MNRIVLAILLPLYLSAGAVLAADPPSCSFSSKGNGEPPSGRVEITIKSMRLNSDMEGNDDNIPFYDNHADVFGTVEINADGTWEKFDLKKISDSDFPHWTEGNSFVSRPAIPGKRVKFVIRLREDDWGATGSNDTVDTSPDPAKKDLEFELDTCSMELFGDVTGSATTGVEVPSGTASNQGTLYFELTMADRRPLSVAGDVALVGFDLVQVLPQASRLIAQKPFAAMVTVANNTTQTQPVSVRIRVNGADEAVLYDATESLGPSLAPGEVRTHYFTPSLPGTLPVGSCSDYTIQARADLRLQPNAETQTGDSKCWAINNSSGQRAWHVSTTRQPRLLWVRTGRLLDAGSLASMPQLEAMRKVAMPFMRGIYPTSGFSESVSSFPLIPPVSGGVYDLVAGLLTGVGIPADAATPFAMVYELNAAAALAGVDRILGVLPKEWFNNTLYGLWEETTGVSLGAWQPRAVMFESVSNKTNDDGSVETGPRLTLPAHELGHTYGLSMDPTIKNPWFCNIEGPVGIVACGLKGGFDEYKSSSHPKGVPTWGYWVPQNSAPLAALTGEQCDSHCVMGGSPVNADANWKSRRRWIDSADYDQLIDKLKVCGKPSSAVVYVSGVITEDDRIHLGWTFVQPKALRAIDFPSTPAMDPAVYAIVFVDWAGRTLAEAELPLNWVHPEFDAKLPVTFFGGYAALPAGTQQIQIWNRVRKSMLAARTVSSNAPIVGVPTVKVSQSGTSRSLHISWIAQDADGDKLAHFVQISPDRGENFWPIAHALSGSKLVVNVTDIPHGRYMVRVLSSDGVNVQWHDASVDL